MPDQKVPPTTDETYRVAVGEDGCGCPITAEFIADGIEVDGSSWTEHRPNCWEIKTESTGYAATAAELRRIADALDTLPLVDETPYVLLSILPEHTAEAVDAVALAVIGKAGTAERAGGDWRHIARSSDLETNLHISIHATVPGPPDPRDAEIERLRAEVADARAATANAEAYLGTNGAVAAAKPDTLMVPHGDPHRTDPTGGE